MEAGSPAPSLESGMVCEDEFSVQLETRSIRRWPWTTQLSTGLRLECFPSNSKLLPKLTFLEVMDCSTMNDQDLVQLAENCTQLDFLIVYHTPQISESGWLKAASFLKHLRKLSVGENLHFQDTAIRAVINSCPKLQEFSISKTGITCEGISYIMGHAPRLDQLYLEYNQRIRRQQIEAILWQKPAHLDLEVYSAGENPIFSEATERNVGDQ
ncbi:hypothetical protein DFS34DRAFT_653266 [Phlyctochytrium arcticum]|nr:hypothetical protein DFS34DRAFT_653266 [Phlyctochytrium arcticum]